MDLICNRKIRKRTLMLPLRHEPLRAARHPKTGRALTGPGTQGTVIRCPLKPGGTYQLQAQPPHERYERWLCEAASQPTRARAVLWLIEKGDEPRKTIKITVLDIAKRDNKWSVRFARDTDESLREHLDSDQALFLKRTAGTTRTRDELDAGEVLAPLKDDLEKARRERDRKRATPQQQSLKRAADDAETLQQSMKNMKARNLVHRAQRNFEAAARLLSEEVVCSDASTAVDGSQGEEERPPHAGAAVASLNIEAA
jgi:hypothetical protein